MQSFYLELSNRDFQRGLIVAVLGAVVGVLNQSITAGSFDFFTYDWLSVLKLAGATGFSYLFKNLLSDESGKFLGKV
jgi:hypothetical protein